MCNLEIWQTAACQNLLQKPRRDGMIFFFDNHLEFPWQFSSSSSNYHCLRGRFDSFLALFFFPFCIARVIMTHALLTFSCPSFLSLQPRFKGHGFPFSLSLSLSCDESQSCKKSSFYHVSNGCLLSWFGANESFRTVTEQLGHEGFLLLGLSELR